jgi:hypothetical protein
MMLPLAFTSRFLSPLVVEVVPAKTGGKIYKLAEVLEYVTSVLKEPIITIPAGYESDGASVPRVFWSLFPPSGQYTAAAVVHDWLCDTRTTSWREAHEVFDEAMRDLNVPGRKRRPMYWAVRWFGPRWK